VSGERVRVLLASPLPPPEGGIATWTRLVLQVSPGAGIARHHVDSSPGARYHYTAGVRLSRLLRQLGVAARVAWAIVRTRPDVFHLTSSYDRGWSRDSFLLTLARLLGAATIVNLRGGDFERFYRGTSARRQREIRETLASCSAVVPITAATAAFLTDIGLGNVRLIPNCIDLRQRRHRSAGEASGRRWLFVGWVMPAKGIVEILDALRAFPDDRLTIVGPAVDERNERSGSMLDAAMRDPQLSGRITHIPRVTPDEARELYPGHDIFVFPSRREGFPNAVLEAMESGLPIVASNVGAIPEMIRDGVDGVLVPHSDPGALIAAISRVRGDRDFAERLGTSARQRVSELYDVRRIVELWSRLYRDVTASASTTIVHPAEASSR
jgi:glycosyltransferase involved in cell wall biosynthesis